ncbi:LPS export ABC transporter periplasmic protein LptC [Marinomonas dokdonensis]|uniref:LPS export ABC transporter periplasmic protein LptC n=1 Tax=Marinomonas dokdonensis TaxID=328224 RepID=UPI0040553F31
MKTIERTAIKYLMLAIVVIAIAAVFWGVNTGRVGNLVTSESLSTSPDYFITKVRIKEFDANGKLIETLNAEQTLHYVKDKKTLLQHPYVERQAELGSWNAQADKGSIEDGSRDILLTENANATKKHINSADITLSSDTIHYLDEDESLTSYGHAKLYSTQGTTTAETIIAYINSEKVVMTRSVRGHYEPTPKN